MIIGETISHYRVLALLGAGGMGEVYKAEDIRLKRAVALKFLPLALVEDHDAKQRLRLEAQAASALDHPNICTIHEIDESADGRVFLAMAYYDGETLKQRIERGAAPIEEAIDIIVQVARGVAAAHDANIIHRDIKPANILLCSQGSARRPATGFGGAGAARVKLLDFGIAKLSGQTAVTRTGTTVGTVAYMSPEQIMGQGVDQRTDLWSLGIVLYELLAGRRPFSGENEIAIIRAIADDRPRPLRQVRPDVPAALDAIVDRALQKDPNQRYASAHDFLHDVEASRTVTRADATAATVAGPSPRRRLSRRTIALGSVALVVAAAVGGWLGYRTIRARSASEMIPEIRGLVQKEQYAAALRRLHAVPPRLAGDPRLIELKKTYFFPLTIRTEPAGAHVYGKGYGEIDADWIDMGVSPIETHGTQGYFRWRVTKPGFETLEAAAGSLVTAEFTLSPEGTLPEGMVRIPGGSAVLATGQSLRIPPFFIDRYEVTNKSFKRFVDAGGYRTREYWQHPFLKDGRMVPWEEAVAEFRDTTGRPGPATWELGTYPEGQDDWPVTGLSWYEADAYARLAGKALPTVHHWRMAAGLSVPGQNVFSDILEWSNFSGKRVARAGEYKGLGPYGTYDMAGNVKEWCANAVDNRRYLLGGGWNEPNYQFRNADARPPFERAPNNGVRLIKIVDPSAVPTAVLDPIARVSRDYSVEKPVGDDVFQAFQRLYAYDPGDLKPAVDPAPEQTAAWRVERVSYAAAYDNERVTGYLYIPKNASPPYQALVYFPHAGSLVLRSFEGAEMSFLSFMIKAGRAVLLPMYKGTYERRLAAPATGPNAQRDLTIQQIKDLARSVDYLSTRSDIASDRIAYFGVSMGSNIAPIALAIERRFKTAVLWAAGFPTGPKPPPPEIDPINFAPRVTTPVLMLNGRDDFTFPVETSQRPMFQMLGTPAADKQRVEYAGGHIFPFARMIKDTLDWLDKFLGVPK